VNHAEDDEGTIENIINCGFGDSSSGWKQVLLFKLSDGKWFMGVLYILSPIYSLPNLMMNNLAQVMI
jgi:hypothetical protein